MPVKGNKKQEVAGRRATETRLPVKGNKKRSTEAIVYKKRPSIAIDGRRRKVKGNSQGCSEATRTIDQQA